MFFCVFFDLAYSLGIINFTNSIFLQLSHNLSVLNGWPIVLIMLPLPQAEQSKDFHSNIGKFPANLIENMVVKITTTVFGL